MVTLRLVAVLVGHVRQRDGRTVTVGPRGGTLRRLATDALLLGADTVARLVVPLVRTVRVDDTVRAQHLRIGVRVLGDGNGGQGSNDELENGIEEKAR